MPDNTLRPYTQTRNKTMKSCMTTCIVDVDAEKDPHLTDADAVCHFFSYLTQQFMPYTHHAH